MRLDLGFWWNSKSEHTWENLNIFFVTNPWENLDTYVCLDLRFEIWTDRNCWGFPTQVFRLAPNMQEEISFYHYFIAWEGEINICQFFIIFIAEKVGSCERLSITKGLILVTKGYNCSQGSFKLNNWLRPKITLLSTIKDSRIMVI